MKDFTLAFTGTFVALDIVGILPMFLSITGRLHPEARLRTVNRSMIVAILVAISFVLSGQAMFRWLSIEISDFKVAGGLVLLLVSLADLIGGPDVKNQASGSTGIVPLAVPLITGPVVLTTLVLQVHAFGYIVTLLSLVANYLIGWLMLRESPRITNLIGTDGTVVFSKIAALLMMAIAVAMIRTGIFESIRAFQIH